MYIPNVQNVIAAGLALTGAYSGSNILPTLVYPIPWNIIILTVDLASTVSSGKILDYAVEKCIDKEGNHRCSKPFPVTKSTCYEIKWTTDGKISHTTAEVRDAGSNEIVFYRDTNGEWTPEKNEVISEVSNTDTMWTYNATSSSTSILNPKYGDRATTLSSMRL